MTELERVEQRLAAVERAVVDGDFELDELADVAAIAADVERLDDRLDELEARLADVEGRAASLSGYVGNVESVNESVERRADAAVAVVDRLERRVEELERVVGDAGEDDNEPRATHDAPVTGGAIEADQRAVESNLSPRGGIAIERGIADRDDGESGSVLSETVPLGTVLSAVRSKLP